MSYICSLMNEPGQISNTPTLVWGWLTGVLGPRLNSTWVWTKSGFGCSACLVLTQRRRAKIYWLNYRPGTPNEWPPPGLQVAGDFHMCDLLWEGLVGELKYRATLNLFIKVEINRQRLHISFPCSVLLNFQVCGLCFYLYMCVYICMHSCICICICPMTLFPTPVLVWWCMCGQTTSALFISLHFTPRSSFSYNHCTYVDRPHTELVHTTFPPR